LGKHGDGRNDTIAVLNGHEVSVFLWSAETMPD
jgi:hypothetical protein